MHLWIFVSCQEVVVAQFFGDTIAVESFIWLNIGCIRTAILKNQIRLCAACLNHKAISFLNNHVFISNKCLHLDLQFNFNRFWLFAPFCKNFSIIYFVFEIEKLSMCIDLICKSIQLKSRAIAVITWPHKWLHQSFIYSLELKKYIRNIRLLYVLSLKFYPDKIWIKFGYSQVPIKQVSYKLEIVSQWVLLSKIWARYFNFDAYLA